MGGNIASIPHREGVIVRGVPQGLDDLEGRGLLALQAVGIDGIDQGNGGVGCHLLDDLHTRIKISADLQDHGAVHHGLGELTQGNLSLRDDHKGPHPRPRCIGRSCGRGIPGGSADDHLTSLFPGLGHGHGHTAILERTGGIETLKFEKKAQVYP